MWDELAISPTNDPKIIRRAYATRLKQLDPDRDVEGFARLRGALEWALAEAARLQPPCEQSDGAVPAAEYSWELFDRDGTLLASSRDAAPGRPLERSGPDLPDVPSDGLASLTALESALQRRDASEAMRLYYGVSASGVLPLGDAEHMLARVFAAALQDPALDRAAFREFAKCFGWDKPDAIGLAHSAIRQHAFERLSADEWYDAIVAIADRKRGTKRYQANVARTILKRVRRPWLFGIDRPALQACLDEYKKHQMWLCDRIDPAWVAKLERRIRWRNFIAAALVALPFVGLLVGVIIIAFVGAVAVMQTGQGLPVLISCVVLLVWLMRNLAGHLEDVLRERLR